MDGIGLYGVLRAVKSYRLVLSWTHSSTVLLNLVPFDLAGSDLLFICFLQLFYELTFIDVSMWLDDPVQCVTSRLFFFLVYLTCECLLAVFYPGGFKSHQKRWLVITSDQKWKLMSDQKNKTSWISMEMESCPASPLQGLGKNPAPFMALPLGLRT